jgi:hypothetical protein
MLLFENIEQIYFFLIYLWQAKDIIYNLLGLDTLFLFSTTIIPLSISQIYNLPTDSDNNLEFTINENSLEIRKFTIEEEEF